MKIYIVLWKDRHSDTTAKPFLDLEEAKAWAELQPLKCGIDNRDIEVISVEGWLYHIEYTVEGDCLWITEHEV